MQDWPACSGARNSSQCLHFTQIFGIRICSVDIAGIKLHSLVANGCYQEAQSLLKNHISAEYQTTSLQDTTY